MTSSIKWNPNTNIGGTFFRAKLTLPTIPFGVQCHRLEVLSGQDPREWEDDEKITVMFIGTFKGEPFTLYDYRGDRTFHIGGHDTLDVVGLTEKLRGLLVTYKMVQSVMPKMTGPITSITVGV